MSERTALYRSYDAADALLYIGISKSFGRRWTQHAEVQPWWLETRRQTVYWYPSREEAEAAETAAIKVEHPKYNIIHAGEARRAASSAWLNEPGGLAWDLYRMRTAARLTGSELAAALGWQRTKISKLENGKRAPTAGEISEWAAACGVPEAAGRLISVLSRHRSIGAHGPSVDSLLRQARVVRSFGLTVIPDLLQTADYARYRAGETALRGDGAAGVEAAVAAGMRRQAILYEQGRQFEFTMSEAALRFLPCSRQAMLGQIDRLTALSGMGGISLGIVPLDEQPAITPRIGFMIMDDTTYVNAYPYEQYLTGRGSAIYSRVADSLAAEAVTGDDARRVLAAAAERLRG